MINIFDLKAVRDWCILTFALKTQIPDMDAYAKKEDIPEKLSELANDKGFLTEMPAATQTRAGAVRPDGTTIILNADGTISAVGSGAGDNGPVRLLGDPAMGLGLLFVDPDEIFETGEDE